MSIRLFLTLIITTLLTSISATTFASGSYGGSYNSEPPKQIDQKYETGKAIYNGRAGVAKFSYCVKVGDELMPVKRKSLKAFKSSSYDNLTNNLVDCAQPETLASDKIGADNTFYVVYYLNKRYKLGLSS